MRVVVSAYTFLSPVVSSILAPSLEQISQDLNIQNNSEKSLCLSIFVLGFAFGPLVLAPISEMYGRRITLQGSQTFFFIFNLACGFAQTKQQFLAFRFFGGLGGSAPLALGPGVLADLFSDDERGRSIGIYTLLPIIGPAIGPICGGFITEYSTWRWGFWGSSIVDVPILIFGFIYLEETYAPVLLRMRKEKLTVETGNEALYTGHKQASESFSRQLGQALLRPMRLMTTQIIVIVMGLYQAYLYGLMYIVLTTFPKLWTQDYHQTPGMAGLNYISLGLGYLAGIEVSESSSPLITARISHANRAVHFKFRCLHTVKTGYIASSRGATTASDVLNSAFPSSSRRQFSYHPASFYTVGQQRTMFTGSSQTLGPFFSPRAL